MPAGAGIVLSAHLGQRPGAEVVDNGPGFEPPSEAGDSEDARERGWGLFFVTQLADRWGVERGSTRVWFELDA